MLPVLTLLTIGGTKRIPYVPSSRVIRALTVLALTASYCFYADRTHTWSKVQKHYTTSDFIVKCAFALCLGLFVHNTDSVSVSTTSDTKWSTRSSKSPGQSSFLSRDQTDEWKGWMQLIILIYHYTGASQVAWIYQIIRLLVASYVFMTGFGQTVYFYQRSDYSLKRVAATLLRLNMISVILAYTMRTDYLFYYFNPMISFWYLIIYITMAVNHQRNTDSRFLMIKIIAAAVMTTMIIRIPFILRISFDFLAWAFKIHWNMKEWRFRLQLDSYIVYFGMVCGVLSIKLPLLAAQKETRIGGYMRDIINGRTRAQLALTLSLVAMTTLIGIAIAYTQPTKEAYNAVLPFLSFAPILTYVLLRNYCDWLRSRHSVAFAWVGRHSLETFTLQFHIWLAADTKGLLSTGLFDTFGGRIARWIDFTIISIVFLWICWHVSSATQIVAEWIVASKAEGGHESKMEKVELEILPSMQEADESDEIGETRKGPARLRVRDWLQSYAWLAGDLRVRLVVIGLGLWTMNVTYA